MRRQIPSQQVPSRRSHWNRQIKHTQNTPALFLRKKIRDKGRRNRHESSFAHAHQRVPDQQLRVRMCNRRQQREPAPEHRAQHDDEFPRVAVRQRPHKRRRQHVEAQKRAGQISNLHIGQMKFVLHQRLHRKQHAAIHVIEQIESRQDNQRGAGLEIGLGHGSGEYSMAGMFILAVP